MNVYILDADVNKYQSIYYVDTDNVSEFKSRFDGTPMKHAWTGKEEFAFSPGREPKGDTPSFSSNIPVFNSKAVNALTDFLEPNGELLPIVCDGEKYFLFNITRIVDSLDEDHCELDRLDDGTIVFFEEYAFFEKKLLGEIVFKIPQDPLGWPYCTDPFVERVKAAKLKGFKFRQVWSSD